ncbi:MAG: hypothetical protein JW908_04335 [Anaerolineales bacterium]|nr:hypothetical protein [Anaerolineales bacterium]
MTTVKVTELSEIDAIAQDDVLLVVDSSEVVLANKSKKIPYSKLVILDRTCSWRIFHKDAALSTGNGKDYLYIPEALDGYVLKAAHAAVDTVSSSGLPTVQIRNVTQAVDMLSTPITIDVSERTSYTASAQPVVDALNNSVSKADIIAADVDGAGTGTKGLTLILTFGI